MSVITVELRDFNGNCVFRGGITSLPLKEEYILEKSMELFNDPEPCVIHRSYIMKKVFLQIEDFFRRKLMEGKNEIPWSEAPCDITGMIDAPGIKSAYMEECRPAG